MAEKLNYEMVKKFIEENSQCEIISEEYLNAHKKLKIKCSCGEIFEATFNHFKSNNKRQCTKCGKKKELNDNYIYNIEDIIETKTGKIKILEKLRLPNGNDTRKGYKCKCIIDGYIGTINESALSRGRGCPVCSNKKVKKGINDIATTHPHLVKYFKNIEDTYKYSYGQSIDVWIKCPICGEVKNMTINDFFNKGFTCPKCSDGISFPEKMMYMILKHLGVEFKYQLTRKKYEWCGDKRYDFYFELDGEQYIIETHGMQHYEKTYGIYAKTLEQEQANDEFKKQLALANGIKEENYIIIDCRYSTLEWIKEHILANKILNRLFDLSRIDWLECLQFTNNSLVVIICEYYNNNKNDSIQDISDKFNIHRGTVIDYLKRGNILNLCNYDSKKQQQDSGRRNGTLSSIKSSKPLKVFKNDIFLGKFNSAKDLERKSEKVFGYKVGQGTISRLCKSNKPYKGIYIFQYV